MRAMELKKPRPSVIFDHDGTVIDSLAMVVAASNAAVVERGAAPGTRARIVADMVYHTPERMGRLSGIDDHGAREAMAERFYELAATEFLDLARPYPAFPAALQELVDRGVAVGIVSNNRGSLIRRLLCRYDLAEYFTVVYGEDDVVEKKPAAAAALQAVCALGSSVDRCVFVGDSAPDVRCAEAAGMSAIGVEWGTTSRDELLAHGFSRVVGSARELLDAILDAIGADARSSGSTSGRVYRFAAQGE